MNKVYWLIGLSGAGKTKRSAELREALVAKGEQVVELDGDVIREGLCADLSYTVYDRKENLRRVREAASMLHTQGLHVIVACITPYEEDRRNNRRLLGDSLVEIFIDTPFTTCMGEDVKGLYAKALARELPNFTGISSRFEPPENPDFVIKRDTGDFAGLILEGKPEVVIEPIEQEDTYKDYKLLAQEVIENCAEYPQGLYKGKGIVIAAGGLKYLTCAWVCINMLRDSGCKLPIEVWYLGAKEMPDSMQKLLKPLNVTCIDAAEVRKKHPARILNGWELKPYSILHSSFEEVLFLDADNVPVADPTYLFRSKGYVQTGSIFWPDFNRFKEDSEFWKILNITYADEPEFESGQMLINKRRCWRELNLTMHINEHSDMYYKHIHGDKDTYHMAWRRLGTEYSMPSRGVEGITGTMCQHDFRGNRIFQHRNTDKWLYSGGNKTIPGFLREAECFRHLKRLTALWDGIIGEPAVAKEDPLLINNIESIAEREYTYIRFGEDSTRVLLTKEGKIEGALLGGYRWWLNPGLNEPILYVGEDEDTAFFALTKDARGTWRGAFLSDASKEVALREVV